MTGLILSLTLAGGPSAAAQPPHILPYPYPGPYYPAPVPPKYNPPPPARSYYPPPAYYPPQPRPYPYPSPLPAPVPHGLTVQQFAASVQPFPGPQSFVVIHPKTGQPVPVHFTLPYSPEPPRVRSGSNWVKFDYRRGDDIEITFKSNGTVDYDYDD